MPSDRWNHPDAYRAHRRGVHAYCDYLYCEERQRLDYEAEETNFVKAIFDALAELNIPRDAFFGSGLASAEEKASRSIPDWLPQEPDRVTRLQAHSQVTDSIAEELTRDVQSLWR